MDAPTTEQWSQVSDIFRDDSWTDEIQGVAWDGSNWIFSANANQDKPGANDKALYAFKGGQPLGDNLWHSMLEYKTVPHPIAGTTESDGHWGQLTFFNGQIFVAHFWQGGQTDKANVVVFNDTNGVLSLARSWIELEKPTSSDGSRTDRAEFQGVGELEFPSKREQRNPSANGVSRTLARSPRFDGCQSRRRKRGKHARSVGQRLKRVKYFGSGANRG